MIPALLIALTVVATLLAGGPSPVGDVLTQLTAITLLAALVWSARERLAQFPRIGWLSMAVMFAVPLLQLIPGGASLAGGDARAAVEADLLVAGIERGQWAPLSLNPAATERVLWSLLPPLAACLAVWTLKRSHLATLVWTLLGLALFQVMLGATQTAMAADSSAYLLQSLYPAHNVGRAVGSFANVNHAGSFILMLLPLAWAMLLAAWQRKRFDAHARPGDAMAVPLLAVLAVIMMVGLILTRSRAVMGLSMIALVVGLLVIAPRARSRGASRFMIVVLAVGLLAAVELGLYAALSRFDKDPMADLRWLMVDVGREAIAAWWPWGSGLGTFVDAFATFLPLEEVRSSYINHAHNDYIELLLEAGLPGALAAVVFLGTWLVALVRVLRRRHESTTAHLLALAAAVGMIAILLHSIVDYPLRSGGVAVAFGVLAGVLARGAWGRPGQI